MNEKREANGGWLIWNWRPPCQYFLSFLFISFSSSFSFFEQIHHMYAYNRNYHFQNNDRTYSSKSQIWWPINQTWFQMNSALNITCHFESLILFLIKIRDQQGLKNVWTILVRMIHTWTSCGANLGSTTSSHTLL